MVRTNLVFALALLASGALVAGACASKDEAEPIGPGSAGDGGTGGTGGEYVDAGGQCRRALEPGIFGCADSYDAALAAPNACGIACAGPAGDQLLFLRDCTPTLRCAYDATTRGLVGAYYGDDVATHCANQYSVIAGDFPDDITLNGYDRDLNCVPPAEASVSTVLTTHFSGKPLVRAGDGCRSGLDQCRGAVRAMVCVNDQGNVSGDGTCDKCRSNADCVAEYHYAASSVSCSPAGHCLFGADLVGACDRLGSGCFTATDAYVCHDGVCAECSTNEECSLSGPYNLCLDGICMNSEPHP